MELGLSGKIALVAASSKGLGKAVAIGLARERAKVVICGRHKKDLTAASDEIAQSTGTVPLAVVADVTSVKDIKRLVHTSIKKFGTVHILVTNAGGPPTGEFVKLSDEQWLDAVNLTLMSTVRLIREVIPHMQKQKWGRIINITSVSVKQPIDQLLLSNALRAAVVGMAKTLSNEVAKDNILVNNVAPGFTLTKRLEELAEGLAKQRGVSKEEVLAGYAKSAPIGRLASPEEFANLVVFLASERASYITGTTIQVDGGYAKGIM
jgi:3-oxoacyl-[acyl-carrier protein] reductase